MVEFNEFCVVFVGVVIVFIGVIMFFVYKLRILYKYIYKVGEFLVIFVGKNLNFYFCKLQEFFFEQIYYIIIIL